MRRQLRTRDASSRSRKSSHARPRAYRRALFEPLETRLALAAPTLEAISNVTMTAGVPMYIALDGYDADGDTLSFSATSSNSLLTGSVPTGNRFMRISVAGYDDMVFELFEDMAPRTTARIISLAQSGFYDGLKFHRVIENFMIQGGDPTGTGAGGSTLGDFDDEFHSDLRHSCAGVLSMAKSDDDTNDSQFFITDRATDWLDYQHSVFGFLTEGESVRDAINSVPTSGSSGSTPVTDVVMQSVSVFTDPDSGVLILKAAANFVGTTTVTVTADDGHGNTTLRSFQVTVNAAPSSYDPCPYLGAIAPIHLTAGQQYSFNIPGFDVEGDPIYYASAITSGAGGLGTSTSTTGQTTLTASATAAGVYALRVRVAGSSAALTSSAATASDYDSQYVPVFVTPAAPTVDLLASSDSGPSDSDNITNHDNTSGNTLRFRVSGVTSGAVVKLFADGSSTPIGQATASGTEVTIETNGTLDLSDGAHTFTATQELADQAVSVGNYTDTVSLASAVSSGLAVTVDTSSPQFSSTPLLTAPQGVAYSYNAETNEESAGNIRYSLLQSISGMTINEQTGQISWTPTAAQVGAQAITIHATDLAGHTVDQAYEVTVSAAATITAISDKTLQEGQSLAVTVTATDTQLPLSYALEGAPQGATIDATTGDLAWSPSEAQGPGQYTITVAVTNSSGAVARTSFAVTVTEQNVAPQLEAIADTTIAEGQAWTFQVLASDADLPANTLSFSLGTDAPAGVSIDAQTGLLHWTPSELQGGSSYAISVLVSDGTESTSRTFTVSVSEVENAPVFTPITTQAVAVGEQVELTVQAQDPDSPNPRQLIYSLEAGAPQGVLLDAQTGELSWTVPVSYSGQSLTVMVRATEVVGAGETALSSTLAIQLQVAKQVEAFDWTWQKFARQTEGAALPLEPAATLPAWLRMQDVPRLNLPTFLSNDFQTDGLFGPQISAHGGGGGVRQPLPIEDRIDAPASPSAQESAAAVEPGGEVVASPERESRDEIQTAEAVDRVLELLAGDPAAAEVVELTELALIDVA